MGWGPKQDFAVPRRPPARGGLNKNRASQDSHLSIPAVLVQYTSSFPGASILRPRQTTMRKMGETIFLGCDYSEAVAGPGTEQGVQGARLSSHLEEGISIESGLVKSLVQPPSSHETVNEQNSRLN